MIASGTDLTKLTQATLLTEYLSIGRYPERYGRVERQQLRRALRSELIRRGVDDVPPLDEEPCRLRPLADHVVVLPEHQPDVTPGGIIRPESAKEVPMQGEVLAVGPGVVEPGIGTRVLAVSVGDQVLFGRYSGIEFTLDEQKLLIMREADVLGVLT